MKNKIFRGLMTATILSLGSLNAQTINLVQGWNLIGITETTTGGNVHIKDVVDKTKISTIYAPSTGSINTQYIEYNNDDFVPGYGYWVKASSENAAIDFTGTSATIDYSNIINSPGWSLISINSSDQLKNVVSGFESQGFTVETIYSPSVGSVNISYIEYDSNVVDPNTGYYFKISAISDVNTSIENPPPTPSLDDNTTSDVLSTPPGVPGVL